MSYMNVSGKLVEAINASIEEGAKVDEVFAALSVQKEVWNVRLAQAMLQAQINGGNNATDATEK